LALTPQNNDAFFREVDEELRRDQLGSFWRRYGWLTLALVVIGLAAFGGYLWWQAERSKAAGLAGEQLTSAFDDLSQSRSQVADGKLKALAADKNIAYSALARLTQAARKLESGDEKGASAAYMAIASDTSVAQPLRDVALIRATAGAFDTLPPQVVIDRLKPLAQPGGAWFGSAGEMTAIAFIKLNQPEKAAAIFAQIAKDKQVPESLRARAVRISGALEMGPAGQAVAAPEKEKSE
jgi:hypothetical protein